MSWYKKSYNREIGHLNRYLRQGFDPFDYMYLIPNFLEEFYPSYLKELEENQISNENNLFQKDNLFYTDPDYFSERWLSDASPEEIEKFKEWVKNENLDASRSFAPPYEVMEHNKFIKPTWLVHFTNDPDSISYEGFTKGWGEMEGLSYTTHYRESDYPGYNFAFRANNYRDVRAASRENKYGENAVLFWGSGVEATHYGDNEDQVIIWGPSVNTDLIIPIYKLDSGYWGIEREGVDEAYPLVENEDITEVINWAIDNVDMLRHILGKWKPKKKKKSVAKDRRNIKTAQIYGEWWITESGDAMFADGDTGDYNHEAYVIEAILGSYFDLDDPESPDMYEFENLPIEELQQSGMSGDEISVIYGQMDAREFAMKNWGWVRVADKYVQSWYITGTTLKNIAEGLFEAYGTDAFRSTYVVESLSNGKNYSPVPYEAIDSGNPKNLLPYREWDPMNLKSSSLNWFKRSQVKNYKYYEDIGHDVEDKMNILWISDLSGNNFHTTDAQHYNEEYDQDYNYDHSGFAYDVGLDLQKGAIQGRFDPNKNIVSLHLDPRIASMRELPNRLLNNLYRAFGTNITILDYSHGSPKVVI